MVSIRELKDGGCDRDAAFLFHRHPVGGCVAVVAAGAYISCQLDGVAVEQQLLRKGGLPGVWMRNDGKGPAGSRPVKPGRSIYLGSGKFHIIHLTQLYLADLFSGEQSPGTKIDYTLIMSEYLYEVYKRGRCLLPLSGLFIVILNGTSS
jgi:hypothetical protein